MTHEDKELLLKDLCARLPYGVIIKHKDEHGRSIDVKLVGYNGDWFNYYIDDLCFHLKIHEFKPYLRPMSSMTEEEKRHISKMMCLRTYGEGVVYDITYPVYTPYYVMEDCLNYLCSIYVDYSGLIEKHLALEAPEGMYDKK